MNQVKHYILTIVVLVSMLQEVQAQFDNYKYVVVPFKFESFDSNNQHQTSSLVKNLFNDQGFNTVHESQLPDDLLKNRCLGLYVGLNDESTMFTTKTTLVMKDCNGQVLFSSHQGRSKKKDYKASFSEAIREAFKAFKGKSHNFVDKTPQKETVTLNFKNDVKSLEEKPNVDQKQDKMIKQVATEETQYYEDNTPVSSNFKKATVNEDENEVLKQETPQQPVSPATPQQSSSSNNVSDMVMIKDFGTLYAQEISNGFQLVDSTPKVRMKLRKSSSPNVFFASTDKLNGVVFSQAGKWIFEYYFQDELISKELNIKF